MLSVTTRSSLDFLRQRWLIGALIFCFVVIYVQYALKMRHSDHGLRSALLRWKAQLAELDEGVNIWEKHAYPNPPMMALILKPIADLSPTVGSSLWFCCKSLLALAAILGVLWLLDSADHPFPVWAKVLTVVLSLRPIGGDLMHGNVNLLILFLIVLSLIAYCRDRQVLAGGFIGLAIACKLTPALFLPYFLWRRAWRAFFGSLIGLILFGLVVPSLTFGWTANLDYLRSWHMQMIAPYAAGVVSSEHKNQSLPALAYRMLSDEASFSDYEGDSKIVLETHNIVSWNRSAIHGIILACMAAYVLLAMTVLHQSAQIRPNFVVIAEFSVVVLGMLLFCERTWKHHCVTLLLPFGVISYCMAFAPYLRGFRWYLGISLTFSGLLMLSTSTGIGDQHLDTGDRFGKLAQVYGAYVWAFLLLLAATCAILWKSSTPSHLQVTRR